MPCYRCGARQTDPDRGPSPWRRGVRGAEQVLICPQCQEGSDWTAELDHCPRCGSTALVRRLGHTACRDCEAAADVFARALPVVESTSTALTLAESPDDAALAAEVAAAIDRVLGRVPAASSAPSREVP